MITLNVELHHSAFIKEQIFATQNAVCPPQCSGGHAVWNFVRGLHCVELPLCHTTYINGTAIAVQCICHPSGNGMVDNRNARL